MYKRSNQANGMTGLSAAEQAKIMGEEAEMQEAALLEYQEGDAKRKLLKDIESGKVERVIVLDQEHSGIAPDEINSPDPNFEMTMLG